MRPRTLYDDLRWGMIFGVSFLWGLIILLVSLRFSGESSTPGWLIKTFICAAIVMSVAIYFCIRHGDNLMKEMEERER